MAAVEGFEARGRPTAIRQEAAYEAVGSAALTAEDCLGADGVRRTIDDGEMTERWNRVHRRPSPAVARESAESYRRAKRRSQRRGSNCARM